MKLPPEPLIGEFRFVEPLTRFFRTRSTPMSLPSIPSIMPTRDFNALSLSDLLEAREAAHVHLARKEGVVATAVGRYLIRDNDPNSKDPRAVYHGDKSE